MNDKARTAAMLIKSINTLQDRGPRGDQTLTYEEVELLRFVVRRCEQDVQTYARKREESGR